MEEMKMLQNNHNNNNIFSVLSNGQANIKVEVKKNAIEAIQEQQLRDLMLIKVLAANTAMPLKGRR